MMSKIDEIVRLRVEAEMALERNNTSKNFEIAASQSKGAFPSVDVTKAASSGGPSFDTQMAVLVSSDFMNIDVVEGKEVVLEFTVENRSNAPWPFKPFVQNEKEKAVKQHVETILQPGKQAVIRYVFRAPLKEDQHKVHMLLQLVEPVNYEKFCTETIVVVCNVQSSNPDGLADSMFELGLSMNGDDYNQLPIRHS